MTTASARARVPLNYALFESRDKSRAALRVFDTPPPHPPFHIYIIPPPKLFLKRKKKGTNKRKKKRKEKETATQNK
jgi:hypothetical protein